jgi:hypothetical protein
MMVTSRWLAALAFDWADSNLAYGIGLAVALLIGAAAIALVKRWRQRDAAVSLSPSEQLAEYRSLYDQGVMSKEEYDRLRALLGAQLRDVKPAPTETAAPPQPAADMANRIMPAPPAAGESPLNPPAPQAGNGQP